MEALRIITEEHQNLWRIAITLDMVADEIDGGGHVETAFSPRCSITSTSSWTAPPRQGRQLPVPIPAAPCAEAAAIIDRLQAEHRNGPDVLRDLRAKLAATAGGGEANAAFTTALRSYAQAVKSHVRSEEKDVMPLAREALTADDWAEIDKAFLDNDDPLFGSKARAEFRELFHRIVNLAPESIGLGGHSGGALQTDRPGGRRAAQDRGHGKLLRPHQGAEGHRPRSAAGRTGCPGRRQRRRQDHLPAHPVRRAADERRPHHLRRRGHLRPALRPAHAPRHLPEPGGRQVFGPLSIEDNLRLGAYTQPKGQVEGDLERVYAMFPILKEKRHLPAGTLSGGQQQMLAIGRALMGRPKMLLLDEPSMGLAPLLVEEVFNVVKALKAEGMTIFLVEQNAFAALAIADRGYVLETGHITLTGTGQELISNEQVRAAYLGM
jgi:branched-chain amino acid transport system ATP-binding protein